VGTAACSASDVKTIAGAGVRGRVDGNRWYLGHARFAAGGDDDDDGIWLGDGTRAMARFQLRETPRADAAATVAALHALGLRQHLCSGDAPAPVARLAAHVGISEASARQTPESKLAVVRDLQHHGRIVAMGGDGINDAPVLAGADVSIAVGAGAALAQRAADFVLTGDALLRIPEAIALARRTQRVIKQNLGWAIAYNLLAVPLAVAGLVTPWIAALGMAVSSLTVTANALRLTRTAP
jgi:Cu2+-exporting ATPase